MQVLGNQASARREAAGEVGRPEASQGDRTKTRDRPEWAAGEGFISKEGFLGAVSSRHG